MELRIKKKLKTESSIEDTRGAIESASEGASGVVEKKKPRKIVASVINLLDNWDVDGKKMFESQCRFPLQFVFVPDSHQVSLSCSSSSTLLTIISTRFWNTTNCLILPRKSRC